MNLILFSQDEVDQAFIVQLPANDARARHILHHLKKTHRGETLRAGIVDGPIGVATIKVVDASGSITLLLGDMCDPPQRPCVELLLGLPYPRVMKQMWPVLSSLGVSRICIFKAELSDPAFARTSALTGEVYEPLILEGLAQSIDTRQPVVHTWHDRGLPDVLSALNPNSRRRLFFDVGEFPTVRSCLRTSSRLHPAGTTVVAIGPERGWTDAEAALFRAAGFEAASIGPSVLRTDVACVAAIALVTDALRYEEGKETED